MKLGLKKIAQSAYVDMNGKDRDKDKDKDNLRGSSLLLEIG